MKIPQNYNVQNLITWKAASPSPLPLLEPGNFQPPSYGLMSSSRLDPRLPGRAFEEPLSEALGSGVGAGAGHSQRNGGFQPTMSQLHQRKVWPANGPGGVKIWRARKPPMIYWVVVVFEYLLFSSRTLVK